MTLCVTQSSQKITFESIASASLLIRPDVVKTTCNLSRLSNTVDMNLYLKNEFTQFTGSVKERGARHSLLKLSDKQRQKGVVVSGGNHTLAMAWHGFKMGIPVTVVLPVIAPIMNVQKCMKFKADVIIEGKNLLEAQGIAVNLAKEKGALFIDGHDNPDVIAGQGTVGLEILEQVPDVHAVVVPTGGGGLLAGVTTAIKKLRPSVKVIGVESVACRSFANALAAGKPEVTECRPTLADGLAISLASRNALEATRNCIDRMIAVQEEDVSLAVLRLIENEKCIVEGAGATPLAAVLSKQLQEFKGKNVVLILSGGNIDTTVLGRVMERGLASDGRLVKVYVTVSDRPGGLAELCKLVGSAGVSIKHINQERAYVNFDIYSVQVKLVCETRDYEHALELDKLLKAHYKDVDMVHAPFPNSSTPSPRREECRGE